MEAFYFGPVEMAAMAMILGMLIEKSFSRQASNLLVDIVCFGFIILHILRFIPGLGI